MKEYRVGIIGGTGMVGQRFVTLVGGGPRLRAPRHPARGGGAGAGRERGGENGVGC